MLIDTHAHIHSADYPIDPSLALRNAAAVGVEKIICVGTNILDSQQAITFAAAHNNCYASVGLHPHDAKLGKEAYQELSKLASNPTVKVIGECGLDYYYNNSPKKDQEAAFRFQIELALQYKLPLIFHIREAFDDFFRIIDEYAGVKGAVHSFTSNQQHAEEVISKGLYISLNGIVTFTKDPNQLMAARRIPLNRLLLETDAPFLTPVPKRGKVNEPANVLLVAEFLSELRQEPLEILAHTTSANACELFNI